MNVQIHRVVIAAAACAVVACANAASAQTCAQPNVPAGVVRSVDPETPAMAVQQGIKGDVQVVVSLDEQSRITGAVVQSSPSKILNQVALDAARASTFQTEVWDCRPVAADYLSIVPFDPDSEPSAAIAGKPGAPTLKVVERGRAARAPDLAVIRVMFASHGTDDDAALAVDRAADGRFRASLRAQGIADTAVTDEAGRRFPAVRGMSDATVRRTVEVRVVRFAAGQPPMVPLPAALEVRAAVAAEYALFY